MKAKNNLTPNRRKGRHMKSPINAKKGDDLCPLTNVLANLLALSIAPTFLQLAERINVPTNCNSLTRLLHH